MKSIFREVVENFISNIQFYYMIFSCFQGGIQALETMLYTIDYINAKSNGEILPGIQLGAHILDDCDTDTRGLQESLDFIKGEPVVIHIETESSTRRSSNI